MPCSSGDLPKPGIKPRSLTLQGDSLPSEPPGKPLYYYNRTQWLAWRTLPLCLSSKVPFWGFPGGSADKESTCRAGELGSIPGLGRCPGEGKGYPLQYSGLENSMDCTVHGVAKSPKRISDFHLKCIYLALEREFVLVHL